MLLPHQELLTLLEPQLAPLVLLQPYLQSQLMTHKRNLLPEIKVKEKAKERGKEKEKEKVTTGKKNKKDRVKGEEGKAAKEEREDKEAKKVKVKVKDLKIQIPNDLQQIHLSLSINNCILENKA